MHAFSVTEREDNIGGIYFADHAITAKRKAASAMDMDSIAGLKVKRADWADRYAPGPVPHLALIAHGWHTDCDGCSRDICQDLLGEEKLVPVETKEGFFCDEACRRQALADKAERTRMETEAADWLLDYMTRKHPAAVLRGEPIAWITSAKPGELTFRSIRIEFTFPGAQFGNASIRFESIGGEPEYTMSAGDSEAWRLWTAKSSN